MIGTVIAVGEQLGRWMYVTRIDENMVYGRMWVSSEKRWTKADNWYSRKAIGKREPNSPKPDHLPNGLHGRGL